MARIELVRAALLESSVSTQGILRRKAFEAAEITVGQTEVPARTASAWHHHGRRRLYGFLVAGRLDLEYGPEGRLVADVRPGDFFRIPPRLVHRDVNPSNEPAVVVHILLGPGSAVINVSGPDPA